MESRRGSSSISRKKLKSSRSRGFNIIGFIQRQMARFLTLDFQLDCLDYEGENWYHADLDFETFKLLQVVYVITLLLRPLLVKRIADIQNVHTLLPLPHFPLLILFSKRQLIYLYYVLYFWFTYVWCVYVYIIYKVAPQTNISSFFFFNCAKFSSFCVLCSHDPKISPSCMYFSA